MAGQYVFEADCATDQLLSSYVSQEAIPCFERITLKGGSEQIRYRVFVTKEEYEAGWEKLDINKKETAKENALTEMTNPANMDKVTAAVTKVLMEEINILRAREGLSAYTDEEINTKIKDALLAE